MQRFRYKIKKHLYFYIACCMMLANSAGSLSQTTDLNLPCSVQFDSIPLASVLAELKTDYNVEFSYSPSIIPENAHVNYTCLQCSLGTVLNATLSPFNIEYQIVGKHFVLTRSQSSLQTETVKKTPVYAISGYIVDKTNGEVMIGASVYNAETGMGTISNKYGFYSLTLPEGSYVLHASYVGYKKAERKIMLSSSQSWNVKLDLTQSMMKELVVTPEFRDSVAIKPYTAQTDISLQQMIHKTNSLGFDDLLKSLENQPGLSFHGDGSSYFYVRGGYRDQNLILLDEAPIYNPSHVFGLFTPITTEVVKKTTIYKADFPIQQGGRLSSLIDIRTRDGNMQHFSGLASLGIYSGLLNIEGPFKKEKSSYFLSYRRSYIGGLIKQVQPNVRDFYFDDLTAKLNFILGETDRVFLTYYLGNDKFISTNNTLTNGLEWGNQSFTTRWNRVFSPRLFANTTFYTSTYDYKLHTNYEEKIFWNSHISSAHLKTDFTLFYNPSNKISFGAKIAGYYFNPGNYTVPNVPQRNAVSKVRSREIVFYGGNQQRLSNRLMIKYGVRLVGWSDLGEAFVVNYSDGQAISFDEYKNGEVFYNDLSWEPRFSLSYRINKDGFINASYNRTLQHINLINNSISPFNSLEVWLPSGPNIKPQKADIINLGWVQNFKKQEFMFQTDVFYKVMQNQIGFNYHAQTVLNPLIENELRQGNGLAYGFETRFAKNYGKLTGEISYAFVRSLLKIDGLNGNRPYPSVQDKPVNLALNLNYQIHPKWMASTNLLYNSGIRITTPTSFYDYKGYQVPVYSDQNNQRLPEYQRVDLSSDFLLNEPGQKTEHHLIFSVYNLFNAKNYAFLYFSKVDENGSFVVPVDQLNKQSYTPTYRYIFSIIPSLTYKLRF